MGNEKFQNRYRISSARASWHAYGGGAYFVTICTAHREHYFGKITGGEMHLAAIGQFVANNLQEVSLHYQYAEIPLFVIMPNHLHAIVIIDLNKIPYTRRDVAENIDNKSITAPMENNLTGETIKMQEIAYQSGWLSVCIGGIKSAVTKYAHKNNIDFEWQSRFHDHIVRNTKEMNSISNYINNNLAQWELDCFYNK